MRTRFRIRYLDEDPVPIDLSLPGRHNVLNAMAAYSVAREIGVQVETIREALATFGGVGRRLEIRTDSGGVTHVDDYGHHPTEIAAVLATVRSVWPARRLVTLFQPHRYSRTRALHHEFGEALTNTDVLLLGEIYAAGERLLPGVSASLILAAVRAHATYPELHLVENVDEAASVARCVIRPGDVLLTLGAGDVWRWGDRIMEERSRASEEPGCAAQTITRTSAVADAPADQRKSR